MAMSAFSRASQLLCFQSQLPVLLHQLVHVNVSSGPCLQFLLQLVGVGHPVEEDDVEAGLLQLALYVHPLLGRTGRGDESVQKPETRQLERRAVETVQHSWTQNCQLDMHKIRFDRYIGADYLPSTDQ